MACSMCEAHINDAVRAKFKVKKISSSHAKKQTVIISEEELDAQKLKEVIEETGYRVLSHRCEPFEKKKLFSFGK